MAATRPLVAVVNDDLAFMTLIRDFLEGEGYETILVYESVRAHATIAEARPALVILDIRMEQPDSGKQVLEQIRQDPSTAKIPVIICSADQPFLRDNSDYLRSRNVTTIPKPFDLDALLALVQSAIDRSLPDALQGDGFDASS